MRIEVTVGLHTPALTACFKFSNVASVLDAASITAVGNGAVGFVTGMIGA
jgi:hypothetical protein